MNRSTTFLPFGSGVTLCPGRKFARNEVKLLLIYLLSKFDFELLDNSQVPVVDGARAGLGIFPPLNDIDVRVTKKQ
jgi:cholesterol 7alpha-monooxygenase